MKAKQTLIISTLAGICMALPAYAGDKAGARVDADAATRAQHGEPAGDSGPYGRARSDTPATKPATPPTSSERAQQGEPGGDSGIYGRGSVGATTQVDKESRTVEQDAATRAQFGAPKGDSGPMGNASSTGEQQPGNKNIKPGGGVTSPSGSAR